MKNRDSIQDHLRYLEGISTQPPAFDEEAIMAAYQGDQQQQSLGIKVLSVFGGILGSLAFSAFILITTLNNSGTGLIFLGIVAIAGSIWINKEKDMITLDTISICCFMIGFATLGFGLVQAKMADTFVCIIFILIALATLFIVQRYLISFVSVLILHGSLIALMISNDAYFLLASYPAMIACLLVYFFRKEAQIIAAGGAWAKLYEPMRIGLVLAVLSALFFPGKKGWLPMADLYCWICSVIIIAAVAVEVSKICAVLNINRSLQKYGLCLLSVIVLLPTGLSPAIAGAMLIMLLCFRVNYKTGLAFGIAAFIYYISQFYYDLQFSLLVKSICMFVSGLLFLAIFLFTNKQLAANEKV